MICYPSCELFRSFENAKLSCSYRLQCVCGGTASGGVPPGANYFQAADAFDRRPQPRGPKLSFLIFLVLRCLAYAQDLTAPASRITGSAELRRRWAHSVSSAARCKLVKNGALFCGSCRGQLMQLGWAMHSVRLPELYEAARTGTLRHGVTL